MRTQILAHIDFLEIETIQALSGRIEEVIRNPVDRFPNTQGYNCSST